MSDTFEGFRRLLPEEACLAALMQARHGGTLLDCPACGVRAPFMLVAKRRAFACQACGHYLYPCAGTPFERAKPDLPEWFFALALLGDAEMRARGAAKEIRRATGLTRETAARMEASLRDWLDRAARGDAAAAWLPILASHVERTIAPRIRGETGLPGGSGSAGSPFRRRREGHYPILAGAFVAVALAIAAFGFYQLSLIAPPDRSEPELANVEVLYVPTQWLSADALVSEEDIEEQRPAGSSYTLSPIAPAAPAAPKLTAITIRPGEGNPEDVLQFGPIRIRRHLVETILKAARLTAVDPVLLMAIADKESSFSTEAKAKTSSATGLYQFIEATWIGVVAEFGPRHGLAEEAKRIAIVEGRRTIVDQGERERILDLRRDPYLSALMAAEMLKRDRARIARSIGRELTHGETYLIHFLGPDGAEQFMRSLVETPDKVAAELMPKPAAANRPIFYRTSGETQEGLSFAEVHKKFESMMASRLERYRNVNAAPAPTRPATAPAKGTPPAAPAKAR